MASVGLIVNASASRDVRRLTSLARTVDVHERANVVARVLCGLAGGGAGPIWYMPEPDRVVERALDALAATPAGPLREKIDLRPVRLPGDGFARDAADTSTAAAAMAAAAVACLITLGGDGTNRAVSAGAPDAVLVPLPGGTNNAFAEPIDPTAAGLATALYAADPADPADPAGHERHVRRRPRLDIFLDGSRHVIALVDVAVVRGAWIGAHAIWDPGLLVEAVLARSDPSLTGLAGVAGVVRPLDVGTADGGVHVRFGSPGRRVLAPLGPGQLVPIEIRDTRVVAPGERVLVPGSDGPTREPVTLAFDGEREIVLEPGTRADVRFVVDGPRVLDAAAVLRAAAAEGRLVVAGGADTAWVL